MQTVQLLPNGKIHLEPAKTTRYNGPLGVVLGTYPTSIALQIKRENE
jgi:hypothetical protein